MDNTIEHQNPINRKKEDTSANVISIKFEERKLILTYSPGKSEVNGAEGFTV